MATCRDIIKAAFKRARITGDVDEVLPREMDRGLQVLQDVYMGLVGSGAFGRFNDVLVTADYTAKEQDRVLVNTEDDISITYPQTVADEAAEGGYRPPRDGAAIMTTDVYSTDIVVHIYDAAYAAWTLIEELALTSYAPLSQRYRAGLEARLAVRLAEEHGVSVTPELRRQEGQGILALVSRYDAPRRDLEAAFF